MKGEIYRGLTPNGVAIINGEHNYIELWQKEIGSHAIQYFNAGDYKAEMSNIHLMAQRLR